MVEKADSIIIGGGIIGMLTARELALGGLRVMLIDKGELGSGCSWAGGGIMSPLYPWHIPDSLQPLVSLSQDLYPDLIASLIDTTGIDPEWLDSGVFILDCDEHEQALSWAGRQQVEIDIIKPEKFDLYVKGISHKFDSAIWIPRLAQVRNPLLIKAVRKNLEQLDVKIKTHEEVSRIDIRQKRYRSVETGRGTYSSGNVVIACGAWSSHLVPELPVYPVRGQMLCFFDQDRKIKTIILYQETYIIPRKDGHVLIGSTTEDEGYNNSVTHQARNELLNNACTMYPDIREFKFIRQWSGLRPGIQGELPLVGEYPGIEGLYLNTGHFRNGLLMSAGSARILMEIMLGRKTSISAEPYRYESRNKVLCC